MRSYILAALGIVLSAHIAQGRGVPAPVSVAPIAIIAAGTASPNSTTPDYSNDPLLVACTKAQAKQAHIWQIKCLSDTEMQGTLCPVLSYQKFCESITRERAQSLMPLKPHYKNTFWAEE